MPAPRIHLTLYKKLWENDIAKLFSLVKEALSDTYEK